MPDATSGGLVLRGITKRFPGGAVALDSADLEFRPGQVHVLFGENGAGKSTLVNVVCGNHQPTAGTMELDGHAYAPSSPADAQTSGVAAVFQEFSLVPTMSVADNIVMGREPVRRGFVRDKEVRRRAVDVLDRLGFPLAPDALVATLSRAQQQMVEIAKALTLQPRVLILDEPTAALTDREARTLFDVVRGFRDQGMVVIYITHRMAEIIEIGDVVSVFRDGVLVAARDVHPGVGPELIDLMTGREVGTVFPEIRHAPGRTALELRGASGPGFDDVSLELRAGEVVGLAGLAGCGKAEVAEACFGARRLTAGQLLVDDRHVSRPTPARLNALGVSYLPPDRRDQGLVMNRSVLENATYAPMSAGRFVRFPFVDRRTERREAVRQSEELRLRPAGVDRHVEDLSGGNQQKVVFARALLKDTQVLVVDDPTVGVDIGARVEIYRKIKELCEGGVAVLLVSSDLNEVLHLASRCLVMAGGRVTAHLAGDALTETNALRAFFPDVAPLELTALTETS